MPCWHPHKVRDEDDFAEHRAPPAFYANYFRIGHNAFEFFLDFGRDGLHQEEPVFHTRIVTSSEGLAGLLELGKESLAQQQSGATQWRSARLSYHPPPRKGSRPAVVLENLEHLDRLLHRAYNRAQLAFEREADGERRPWEYRGLHIGKAEAERLLGQPPGSPVVSATEDDAEALDVFNRAPVWGEFGERLELTSFDLAITMLALAPEVDVRYERLYAYLQDDVTRSCPTVNLALDVLSPTAETKVEWRSRFAESAKLRQTGLLRLIPDPARPNASLLDQLVRLDAQAIAYLVGDDGLEGVLATFGEIVEPVAGGRIERPDLEALASVTREAWGSGAPMVINFHGPRGARQRQAAESIASAAGARLLAVDLAAAVANPDSQPVAIAAVFQYAWLHHAVLFLDGADRLPNEATRFAFNRGLMRHRGIVIVNSANPWEGQALHVPFAYPDFAARRGVWHAQTLRAGIAEDQQTLDALAGRFVLTHDQIARATAESALRLRLLAAERPDQPLPPDSAGRELLSAARAQAGQDLAALAHKVEPVYGWQDIVVTEDTEKQLREISARASFRYRVLEEWGFGKKLAQANGISVLFTGPSGSGKTMAAEVLAGDLMLDLYKIDLSVVVSKYIGETERNLERIFAAAERSNAILFFDEADALFGKRSEVQDAHDRYANIEVSYLLQRMEQFEGIAILATNLRGNLDEAFVRRLDYTVRFALPGAVERLKIWNKIWPSKNLLGPDVDLAKISETFKLSGGNIRNIVLAASFFAAERDSKVMSDDLLRAIQREYEKVGKTMSMAELREAVAPGKAA
jgi:hypothetical protein